MEADGIITRTVYPEVPPRVEYALSELGESMRPIIKSMEAWGNNYKQGLEIADKVREQKSGSNRADVLPGNNGTAGAGAPAGDKGTDAGEAAP